MNHLPCESELLKEFCRVERLKTRIDVDGTLTAPGKWGHLYQYSEGLLAVIVAPNAHRKHYWAVNRKKLAGLGCIVVQDGDHEGAVAFDPYDANQGRAAIIVAGVLRKRQLSSAQVERQLGWLRGSAGEAL